MRIRTLIVSMVAGLALVGCSSEEDIAPGGGELGSPQFLRVNLVTNPISGLRAGGDQSIGDPNKDDENNHSIYEEGLDAENKVTKVRFYFFDAYGNAAEVKNDNGTYRNYLEWTNVLEDNDEINDPNKEKILSTTLIIQSPKKDKIPAKIVAVINPSEPANAERNLTSLGKVAHDYKAYTTSGEFVMSNSTYSEGGIKKMAVSVEGKLKETSGEALEDPVDIYVERVIAKVRLGLDKSFEDGAIPGTPNMFKTSADNSQKVTLDGEEKEIYVKFLGWNTTAVSTKSRLVKEINPAWPNTLFGTASTPWNWAEYFRSFWAINANGVEYDYGAFVPDTKENPIDGNKFQAQAKTKFDGKDWVYVNENASPYSDNPAESVGENAATPTKVIISAQLVDEKGNALEFAEYGSTRTSIDGLKKLFADNCGLYKKETVTVGGEQKVKFTKIAPEDLTVKTATAVGEADIEMPGRYKSFVQLAKDENGKWYASNKEDATAISADEANKQLKALGSAKVWKNGYTYYYFDINHLGTKIGVVRNHIYDAKITSLTGLGTPVYNPEEIIYPEKPVKDNDTFIAARINILSWRVVPSNVELNW